MNKYDEQILQGRFPPEPPPDEPPAPPGHSYYWDCRARTTCHDFAVLMAAREMGQARSSIQSLLHSR